MLLIAPVCELLHSSACAAYGFTIKDLGFNRHLMAVRFFLQGHWQDRDTNLVFIRKIGDEQAFVPMGAPATSRTGN